jgi:hypothetical protein
MISKETLEAVKIGILTNEQLDEALSHYRILSDHLQCHDQLYHLVWKDVFMILMTLEGYKKARQTNKNTQIIPFNKIALIKQDFLLDGGTSIWIRADADEKNPLEKFYLDYRIGSSTKGELYLNYPGNEGAVLLNKELYKFIE